MQASSLPYLDIWQQGSISLTQSPNNTTTSYFEVSTTGKYKVNIYFNWYVTTAYNTQFALYDITNSISLIWSNSTVNIGQNLTDTIIGVVDLIAGNTYTIDFGNGTTFAGLQIKSFGLIIEEIYDTSNDTFTFNDNSLK